jgi:hypothetical protein
MLHCRGNKKIGELFNDLTIETYAMKLENERGYFSASAFR